MSNLSSVRKQQLLNNYADFWLCFSLQNMTKFNHFSQSLIKVFNSHVLRGIVYLKVTTTGACTASTLADIFLTRKDHIAVIYKC